VLGTRVLTLLSPRAARSSWGFFVLIFVTLSATGLAPKIPPRWEALALPTRRLRGRRHRWGHQLARHRASSSISRGSGWPSTTSSRRWAFAFFFYKLVQLGAVTW